MITIDFETRATVDLGKVGAHKYARHRETQILCLAFSLNGRDVQLWLPEDPAPQNLLDRIADGDLVEAHNVFFERNIWRHICHKRLGWIDVPFNQWRCSMAAAARLALPRKLADVATAVGAKIEKDLDGRKIMLRLCKPKAPSANDPSIWDNDPVKFARLYSYCKTDVSAEIAVSRSIDPLTDSELRVWQLDQQINLRGLPVDLDGARKAKRVVESVATRCNAEIEILTGGQVQSAKQVKALTDWISETQGEQVETLAAPNVAAMLERDDLQPVVRKALEVRQRLAKASTAKLDAILNHADDDGRVRGCLRYHGAATGRWAGSGIQIQNFPRGTLGQYAETIRDLCELGNPDHFETLLGDPLECISSALRSFVCARPGYRLFVCDFASIEARVLAWLCGETELVNQFAQGDDVYKSMASRIYKTDVSRINKTQRQVGKTAILGLGYGMGANAFKDTCKRQAGVDMGRAFANDVVKTYRTTNAKINGFWGLLNQAVVNVIKSGRPQTIGRIYAQIDGDYLTLRLPSNRKLYYRQPSIDKIVAPWSKGYEGLIGAPLEAQSAIEDLGVSLGSRIDGFWIDCNVPATVNRFQLEALITDADLQRKTPKLIERATYMSLDSVTRKWQRTGTYGGKLTENITQAIAADFLREAMLRIDRAGYPIVATVHDEIIAEVPDGFGSIDEFNAIVKQVPKWGRGCPIDVEGYASCRYRK